MSNEARFRLLFEASGDQEVVYKDEKPYDWLKQADENEAYKRT